MSTSRASAASRASRSPRSTSRTLATPSERLPSGARREQLLRTAGALLEEHGVDGLELTRLAAAAGVSRPIVYRFFANRQALIVGLLEDLEAELVRRFDEVTSQPLDGGMREVTRRFVDAVCDAIEAKGRGPWELLGSKGPDPEAARLAKKIHTRLLAPWHAQIAAATGVSPRKAAVVSRMLVAAGRAALEEWYAGRASRSEAAGDAARGVSALLVAFADADQSTTQESKGTSYVPARGRRLKT